MIILIVIIIICCVTSVSILSIIANGIIPIDTARHRTHSSYTYYLCPRVNSYLCSFLLCAVLVVYSDYIIYIYIYICDYIYIYIYVHTHTYMDMYNV